MVRFLILLAGLLSPFPAAAQDDGRDTRSAFSEAVQAASMPIEMGAAGLAGPGADFLVSRGRAADLVMIGEQHATADIAAFATFFYSDIADAGFGAYVAEIGPWSAQLAEPYLEAGMAEFAAEARLRAGGLGYPFLFFTEDAALARAVVTHPAAAQTALWGVD